MKGLWTILAELATSHLYQTVAVDMHRVPEGVPSHKLALPERQSEEARKHLAVLGFRSVGSVEASGKERFEVGVQALLAKCHAHGHGNSAVVETEEGGEAKGERPTDNGGELDGFDELDGLNGPPPLELRPDERIESALAVATRQHFVSSIQRQHTYLEAGVLPHPYLPQIVTIRFLDLTGGPDNGSNNGSGCSMTPSELTELCDHLDELRKQHGGGLL